MNRVLDWLCHAGGVAVRTLERMEHDAPRLLAVNDELEAKLREVTSGLDALEATFDAQDWQRALASYADSPVGTSPDADLPRTRPTTGLDDAAVRRLPSASERSELARTRSDGAAAPQGRVVPMYRRVPESAPSIAHGSTPAALRAKPRNNAPGSRAAPEPSRSPQTVPRAQPGNGARRPEQRHAELADAASERWSLPAARTRVVIAEPARRVQELLLPTTMTAGAPRSEGVPASQPKGAHLRGVELLAALCQTALDQSSNSPSTTTTRPAAGPSNPQTSARSSERRDPLPLAPSRAPAAVTASELRGLAGLARRLEFTPASDPNAQSGADPARQSPVSELTATSLPTEMEARAKLEARMGEVLRRQAERQGIDLQRGRG